MISAAAIETALALTSIAAGAPAVGLVACAAIGACMLVYVIAEVVAFYRVGLPPSEPVRVQELSTSGQYRPRTGPN